MICKPHRIFAENLEPEALAQFESAMEQPFVVRGALMPDAHTGYSLPIGAVVATDGVVVPSWVGYDIGCGVCALPTTFLAADVRRHAERIFADVYRAVPTGFAHNRIACAWAGADALPRSPAMETIFTSSGLRQMGSLGGGNHFIEIGHGDDGVVWIVVHSGSRGIGHAAATHHMKLASGDGKAREGHFGFATDSLDGKNYIDDLRFCQEFALANRREVVRRTCAVVASLCEGEGQWHGLINRNHNHAECKDGLWIHRKGATHAELGMLGVIPGNMRDGSFVVVGKGDPEALWSSSHGAGRAMGRKAARRELTVEAFAGSMDGIVARVEDATLDEAPAAYKDIHRVMDLQSSMVSVLCHIRPIINVKG